VRRPRGPVARGLVTTREARARALGVIGEERTDGLNS